MSTTAVVDAKSRMVARDLTRISVPLRVTALIILVLISLLSGSGRGAGG